VVFIAHLMRELPHDHHPCVTRSVWPVLDVRQRRELFAAVRDIAHSRCFELLSTSFPQ
jgi:hypothetical protein